MRAGVIKKFGVDPDHITDYLALIGDKSDNVPGVDKVGPKTAVKWLQEYSDIEGVIKNAESIGGKVGENLRSSIETLKLAHELVKIKIDVPLEVGIEDLKVKNLVPRSSVSYIKSLNLIHGSKNLLRKKLSTVDRFFL